MPKTKATTSKRTANTKATKARSEHAKDCGKTTKNTEHASESGKMCSKVKTRKTKNCK
ncbi:MAG: hypothetical protein IK070_00325 [Clostridia bacterium]|nr:hypothetical protein [Clostridia bacterium]